MFSKIHKVFRQGVMKNSSHQFGNQFSGFDRQHGKVRQIGACIGHNFMPCNVDTKSWPFLWTKKITNKFYITVY